MTQPPISQPPNTSVGTWLSRLRIRLAMMIDDALPLSPEDRRERDWSGETSDEEAERRQLLVRLKILAKEGTGGYR